jgi:hypothetical protein
LGVAMSEQNGKPSKGTMAFNWIVGAAAAALLFLSVRLTGDLDRLIAHVESLQIGVSTMTSRIDAHVQRLDSHERRNDLQDSRIEALQQQLWTPRRSTP